MKTDTAGFTPLEKAAYSFGRWLRKRWREYNTPKHPFLTGFTLAEILVVMAIITLIMTTVLYNTPLFNSIIAMTQAARTVAFSLRDAQSRAVAVQSRSGSPPDTYGVWVTSESSDLNLDGILDNQQYVLFTDSGDSRYTPGTGDCGGTNDLECIERYTFQRNIRFSSLL
ncbi:MAG: type II secretion system protein, partial [Candidatus Ryanbacteria bacterium]|nr:type II secretion system protein [Candidatus Ryanbacteria bacterium]